jgi:serine/threonine-protein kinase RsbW
MDKAQAVTIGLSLPSELGYEKIVRQTLTLLATHIRLDAARTADLQTATSEACINAIEHGNHMIADLRLTVTLRLTEKYLEVVVGDEGLSRLLLPSTPPPSIQEKLAGLGAARGMGLLLIQQLVDEADFLACEPGKGNRVRLRMYAPVVV